MGLSKRVSLFGIVLLWVGLIPLYLALISQNIFLELLGFLLFGGWFIVYKRCQDLDLFFVMVKKISSDWSSTPLALSWFVANFWVLWHATDGSSFLWVWAITATTATLRTLIEVGTNTAGEKA